MARRPAQSANEDRLRERANNALSQLISLLARQAVEEAHPHTNQDPPDGKDTEPATDAAR